MSSQRSRPHRLIRASILLSAATVAASAVARGQTFLGQNFTASTRGADSTFVPPDTMGAAGVDHFVELINGRYTAYRKSDGARVQSTTLNQFWANAGAPHSGSFSFDPRVLYDPYAKRWFALAVDAPQAANSFLLAVSNSSDPTQGWRGFKIDSDANNSHWADFPMLGMNRDSVVMSANMFPLAGGSQVKGFVVVPKADLLLPTPTIANATSFQDVSTAGTGFSVQPAVDLDDGVLPLPILSRFGGTSLKRSSFLGPVTAPTLSTAGGSIVVPSHTTAPNADQPGPKANINAGDNRFSGNVILNDGELWAIHTVNVSGRAGLRWYRLNATTNALIESGTIADPSLAYFYPSIAVNDLGDVVIGMSGTDPVTFVSTYAVVGKTIGATTTFGSPFQTKAGVSDYQRLDGSGRNRWGDYSATTNDPADPSIFWTIQEWVSATDQWSTQATEVIVPQPGEVRWRNPASGDFTDGTAWFGGVVPAGTDHVIFSRATDPAGPGYTVGLTVGASATVDRLSARQGRVTMDLQLNTLNVVNPSATDASFIVGEFGGAPTLRITNGTLRTQNSIIARAEHSMGSVILDNATWINQQDLYVGGDVSATGGAATVNITAGASLSVGGSTMLRPGGAIISAASAIDLGSIGMEGGRITLTPGGGKVIRGDALAMPAASSGIIELRDNGMILDYGGASPIATVRDRIRDAYAGGAWTGSGITSADADATSFGIGFGEAGEIFTSFPATFLGHGVPDHSAVLARLTRYGDANLDGTVNLIDFNILASNFGASAAFWHEADFNYDALVNLGDFNLLAANFGLSAGPDGPTPDDWAALASAVPEPSLAAALAGVPLLTHRRRRIR